MLVFRNITEEEIDFVEELEKKTFSDAWSKQSIYETFCQSQAYIIVVESENGLAGYGIVYSVLDEAELVRIAVDEKARRQGVGQGLIDYIFQKCQKENIRRVLLEVRESNLGARVFYEKCGFAVDGIRKNFYENPKENAVLMSKTLV